VRFGEGCGWTARGGLAEGLTGALGAHLGVTIDVARVGGVGDLCGGRGGRAGGWPAGVGGT